MAGLLPPVRDIGVLGDPVRSFLALCGLFTLVLLGLWVLDRLGLESGYAAEAVIVAAFATFALVALFANGRRPADFYVADQSIRPWLGGAAAASGLVGLLVIGLAGGIFSAAAEVLIASAGFLLGIALLALVAPGLRRAGGTSLNDFFAMRYGIAARLAGAAVALVASLLVFVAVLKTAGPLVSALLGLPPEQGVYLAAGLSALAALTGGMRSLTWTQLAQYLVMALACLMPLGLLLFEQHGAAAPGLFAAEGLRAGLTELVRPFGSGAIMDIALPMLLLAIGTASLPQLLARVFAAPSGRAGTASMLWAFAAAVFLIGSGLILGQVLAAATGVATSGETSGDVLTRAMPLLVALPPILVGLFMAGLLAALLAAGQAALLAAANALSRDLWDEILDRRGPAGRRILVARALVAAVAYGAVWLTARWSIDAPALLGWALAFAAAGNLAPLLLGLYWRRCRPAAGAFGIASGFGMAAAVFLLDLGHVPLWREIGPAAGIGSTAAAALGLATAFLVSVALSLLGRPPEHDVPAHAAANRREPLRRERPA